LERVAGRWQTTAAGAVFYQRAQDMLALVDRTERELAAMQQQWLKKRLKHGVFTGVLRGEELARAYANMDVFVFPSRTDTFGNVVQESAASQVPAVVTNEGGPRHLVAAGVTGYVAASNEQFIQRVLELARDGALRQQMGAAARERVAGISWDAAFDLTYAAYRYCTAEAPVLRTAANKAGKAVLLA